MSRIAEVSATVAAGAAGALVATLTLDVDPLLAIPPSLGVAAVVILLAATGRGPERH